MARREVDTVKVLVILNEPPDGAERTYNGLRLAASLARRAGVSVRVFLIGDAVTAAKASRDAASRDTRVETMLAKAIAAEATVGLCGSCMDARGVAEAELVEGARRELAGGAHDLDARSGPCPRLLSRSHGGFGLRARA